MRKVLILLTTTVVAGSALAQTPPTEQQVANAKYMGTRTCRPCHMSAAQGRQYAVWDSSLHAAAYRTLGTDQAKTIGSRLGVTNPQTDARCLKCHVTAATLPAARRAPRFDQTEGVGCEACHGPGEFYKAKSTMCQITTGQLQPACVGLVVPTEQVCVTCHNQQSPTYKPFNFQTFSRKIAHPIPAARKQQDRQQGCGAGASGAGGASGTGASGAQ